jgi:hypothetical protein
VNLTSSRLVEVRLGPGASVFVRQQNTTLTISDSPSKNTLTNVASDATIVLENSPTLSQIIQRSLAEIASISNIRSGVTEFQRAFSDMLSLSDATGRTKAFVRALSESLSQIDLSSRLVGLQRFLSESLTIQNLGSRQTVADYLQEFAESLSLSDLGDSIISITRFQTDSVGLAELGAMTKGVQKLVYDTLAASDAASAVAGFQRLVSQSLSQLDAISLSKIFERVLSEQIAETDTSAISRILQTSVSELLSSNDLVNTVKSIRLSISQSVGVADLSAANKYVQKAFADLVSYLDAVSKGTATSVSEVASLDELIDRLTGSTVFVSEGIDLSSFASSISGIQKYVSESLGAGDFVGLGKSVGRFGEVLTSFDDLAASVEGISRGVEELLSQTNLIGFNKALESVSAQTASFSDAVGINKYLGQSVTGLLALVDFSSKGTYALIYETANFTDFLKALSGSTVFVSESLNTESLTAAVASMQRFTAEAISVGTANLIDKILGVSVSDGASFIDLGVKSFSFQKILTESLGVTDSNTAVDQFVRIVQDILSQANLAGIVKNINIGSLQQVSLSQITSSSILNVRSVSEALASSDAIQTAKNIQRFVSEIPGLQEISNLSKSLERYFSESIGIGESGARQTNFVRFITQFFSIISSIQETVSEGAIEVSVSETIFTGDAARVGLVLSRLGIESLQIPADNSITKSITVRFATIVSLRDSVIAQFIEFIESIATPGGGGGGGGGGAPSSPSSTPSAPSGTGPGQIVKTPLVLGGSVGGGAYTTIDVQNTLSSSSITVRLEVSGVPGDWVTVSPFEQTIDAGGSKSFVVVFDIPENANIRDYTVQIVAKSGQGSYSSTFILRAAKNPATSTKPVLTRTVNLDMENDRTEVTINFVNIGKSYAEVQVLETIDKSVAETTDELEFVGEEPRIIKRDPQVLYTFRNVGSGETRVASYIVKGATAALAEVGYWPFEQITFVEERFPVGFKIHQPSEILLWHRLDNTISITLESGDDKRHTLNASIDLPSGWSYEPAFVEDEFDAFEKKKIEFRINVPADARRGTYIATVNYVWDGTLVTKDLLIKMDPVLTLDRLVIIGVIAAGLIVALMVFLYMRRRREPARQANWLKMRAISQAIGRQAQPQYRYTVRDDE